MSLDPAIIGGAVTVAVVAIAAGYSYLTGNEADVDLDDDGNDDITFEGSSDGDTHRLDGAEPSTQKAELPTYEAAPDDVREIGTALADITGIGDTRADDLKKAGFHNAADIYFASDEELKSVSGIGDLTVSQIRGDIGSVEDEGKSQEDDTEDAEKSSSNDESEADSTSDETADAGDESDDE